MTTDPDDVYEVVIVRYGTRTTRRSEVFLNYHLYGEADAPIDMDYFFWVVRNAHRTFVVDTGFSQVGGSNRGRTFLVHPGTALDMLGIDRAAAKVILTHGHYDHIGNVDLFPASTIFMPESEFDFWTGPYAHKHQFHHSVEDSEIDHLRRVRDEGRLHLLTGTQTIAPGLEVIEVGGHSPGQTILVVDTVDGPVLLASDATHYYEELEREMPFLVVADLAAMYAGFDTMKQIAYERRAILVPGHDPHTLDRHEPYGGALTGIAASIGRLPTMTKETQ